jgi:hypothetical protein
MFSEFSPEFSSPSIPPVPHTHNPVIREAAS